MNPASRSKPFALAVLIGLAAAGSLAPRGAAAQSAIKVIVNGEAITTNEINQRARFLRLVSKDIGPAATRLATEEMIEEKLKLAEAKRLKVTATDQQVDNAFAAIAARSKIAPAQLAQALAAQGIEVATFKARLRTQLVWQQLVVQRFQRTVTIADASVMEAIERQKLDPKGKAKPAGAEGDTTTEYTLAQVTLVVAGKPDAGILAQRNRDAEAIRAAANGCDGLIDVVKRYKESVYKQVGKRTADELPENFRDLLAATPVGKLTKPQVTANGVEILAVCDKREIKGNLVGRTKVEDDLREKEGQVLARQYIAELRKIAVVDYK
jgi:peptidyl-prolyl cis-trans isomerase SurA